MVIGTGFFQMLVGLVQSISAVRDVVGIILVVDCLVVKSSGCCWLSLLVSVVSVTEAGVVETEVEIGAEVLTERSIAMQVS